MCSVYSEIPSSVIPGSDHQFHFTDEAEAGKTRTRAGEVAPWLRADTALAEDPGSSLRNHMVASSLL